MLLALVLLPLAVAVAGTAVLASLYNRLATLRNRYRNAYAQIDVQLKRRYELVPRLVETARGYLQHERDTLERVTAARARAAEANRRAAAVAGQAQAMRELGGAETALAGSLTLFATSVENYPNLKADKTMAALMAELSTTENRVAFARQCYNDNVMAYNTARETFPGNVLAARFGFGEAHFFQVDDAKERDSVGVKLGPPG